MGKKKKTRGVHLEADLKKFSYGDHYVKEFFFFFLRGEICENNMNFQKFCSGWGEGLKCKQCTPDHECCM